MEESKESVKKDLSYSIKSQDSTIILKPKSKTFLEDDLSNSNKSLVQSNSIYKIGDTKYKNDRSLKKESNE